MRKDTIKKIQALLDKYDYYKNTYFWTPNSHASGRRSEEERNTFSVKVNFTKNKEKIKIEYNNKMTCSCRNVYNSRELLINGKKVTRRAVVKLIEG